MSTQTNNTLASKELIEKTILTLGENNFNPIFVETKEEALKK